MVYNRSTSAKMTWLINILFSFIYNEEIHIQWIVFNYVFYLKTTPKTYLVFGLVLVGKPSISELGYQSITFCT